MAYEKGTLPKAYLRTSPDLDEHPEWEWLMRLIFAANRQPRRGRFREELRVRQLLKSKDRVRRFLERGDLVWHNTRRDCNRTPEHERLCEHVPHLYLDGWDEWQESDLDVATRMRRLRSRRHRGVTEASLGSNDVTEEPRIPDEPPPSHVTPSVTPAASPGRNDVTTGVRRQASGVLDTPFATRTLARPAAAVGR